MTTGTTSGGSSRFPGNDVLGRAESWDPVTTEVVLRRLGVPTPLRFFLPSREPTVRALLDRLLAQDADPKIPLVELVDARLADGETDGWRYDDMPEDRQAWNRSVEALDADAATRTPGARFADLGRRDQLALLESVRTSDEWHGLPARRVWSLWMRYACAAFYSHPWAWNEIGFGGPAYPVGYKNLGVDGREAWEVREHDARDPEPWAERVAKAHARHGDTWDHA